MTSRKRLAGNVELTVIGNSRQPESAAALIELMRSTPELTGHLFIAYPLPADAVLVSAQGQVTAIDLQQPDSPGAHVERQDIIFVRVQSKLRMAPALNQGRTPKVLPQTVTILPDGSPYPTSADEEHPVITMSQAAAALTAYQRRIPQDVDPQLVVDQILWLPSTE